MEPRVEEEHKDAGKKDLMAMLPGEHLVAHKDVETPQVDKNKAKAKREEVKVKLIEDIQVMAVEKGVQIPKPSRLKKFGLERLKTLKAEVVGSPNLNAEKLDGKTLEGTFNGNPVESSTSDLRYPEEEYYPEEYYPPPPPSQHFSKTKNLVGRSFAKLHTMVAIGVEQQFQEAKGLGSDFRKVEPELSDLGWELLKDWIGTTDEGLAEYCGPMTQYCAVLSTTIGGRLLQNMGGLPSEEEMDAYIRKRINAPGGAGARASLEEDRGRPQPTYEE
jgi:hypothetical protein